MQEEYAFQKMDKKDNREYGAEVRRVTWLGLVVNTVLACIKVTAGYFGHSQAVVADGIHSFSDSISDVAILVGVRYWSAPADKCHPHGHRRVETLVTVLIGLVLTATALGLVVNALSGLKSGISHTPGWIAFFAALASIVVKEGLYRWTLSVGQRQKSSALIANAWHHRSDAISSVPAALAVAGATISPTWEFLDHVGAIVVSFFILQAAWKIIRPALDQLIDAAAPEEELDEIRRIALAVAKVHDIHKVRTRYLGSGLQIDLHVLVDGNLSVREGHDVSEKVEECLLESGPHVLDVVVHIEPY